jgi:hypothetical protein
LSNWKLEEAPLRGSQGGCDTWRIPDADGFAANLSLVQPALVGKLNADGQFEIISQSCSSCFPGWGM